MVTSISCPYFSDGVETIPNYADVIKNFQQVGFDVTLAIIGRDSGILSHQQRRVRGKVTKDMFLPIIESLMQHNPIFVSTELLYLYRQNYLKSLEYVLNIPIDYDSPQVDAILRIDPNKKYFCAASAQPLDRVVANASQPIHLRK